jgi:hypothetical protein
MFLKVPSLPQDCTFYIQMMLNIKLMLYNALIRSVMTHACPTWGYAADAHLLKLQRMQNRLFRATGNLDRSTPVRKFHVAFKIPYVYDYITKLCRTQVEVILNHVNTNARGTGQADARLKLDGGQACDRSAD